MIPTRSIVRRKKKAVSMTGDHYRLVAMIINEIPGSALRKAMADHFATAFNRRSVSFDPMQWNRATGGTPAANSAR